MTKMTMFHGRLIIIDESVGIRLQAGIQGYASPVESTRNRVASLPKSDNSAKVDQ